MRIGAKKHPFYRVVAIDERSKRNGRYLELLGTYNPMRDPKEINLKKDRIEDWVKKGAQPSIGYLRMIGKAPQRPPRKPKKEKKAKAPAAPETPKAEEIPKEEAQPEQMAKPSESAATGEVEPSKEEIAEGAKVDEASPVSEPGEVSSEIEVKTVPETSENEKPDVVDDSGEKTEIIEEGTSESSK